jgi:hypothetical protein
MHRPDARGLGRQALTFVLVVVALWGFWEAFRVLGEARCEGCCRQARVRSN